MAKTAKKIVDLRLGDRQIVERRVVAMIENDVSGEITYEVRWSDGHVDILHAAGDPAIIVEDN